MAETATEAAATEAAVVTPDNVVTVAVTTDGSAEDATAAEDATTTPPCEKETGESPCGRAWIGIALALVSVLAIASVTLTLVMDARKKRTASYADPKDPYFYGLPVEEGPFEIVVVPSNGSSSTTTTTKPYASIEELKADVENLLKSLANAEIVNRANEHYYLALRSSDRPNDYYYYQVDDFFDRRRYDHRYGKDEIRHDRNDDHKIASNGEYIFLLADSRIQVMGTDGQLFGNYTFGNFDGHTRFSHKDETSLLINPEGDRLTIVVLDWFRHKPHKGFIDKGYEYTYVAVFEIRGSSLAPISQANITGTPVRTHIAGNHVHIVTSSRFNTQEFIRWAIPSRRDSIKVDGGNVTNEMFLAAAKESFEERLPELVDRAVEDFVGDGDKILLSRMIGYETSIQPYEELNLITSFDVGTIDAFNNNNNTELQTEQLMIVGPETNYGPHVHSSDGWFWILKETASRDDLVSREKERRRREPPLFTTFYGVKLEGASSRVAAMGSIPGFLLSENSIDFVKDDVDGKEFIRVAVTINTDNDDGDDDGDDDGRELRTESPTARDFLRTEASNARDFPDEDELGVANRVIVLEIPDVKAEIDSDSWTTTELIPRGTVGIGGEGEMITAVRFFGDTAYVLPLDRNDPIYAVDMKNPNEPIILGQVSGFSKFMYPMNEDNSMYLTFEEDLEGFEGHLTVSIFDATTVDDPQLVESLVVKKGEGYPDWFWSFQTTEFQYYEEYGILAIPAYKECNRHNGCQKVEGFAIFRMNDEEATITREPIINHRTAQTAQTGKSRYNYLNLATATTVVGDMLITSRRNMVVGTDIHTLENKWTQLLEEW